MWQHVDTKQCTFVQYIRPKQNTFRTRNCKQNDYNYNLHETHTQLYSLSKQS